MAEVSPRVDDWYPWVADVTFPTEFVALSDDDVRVLLDKDDAQGATLLAARVQAVMDAAGWTQGVFIRMSCLSPKDATKDDANSLVTSLRELGQGLSLKDEYSKQMRLLNQALFLACKINSGAEAIELLRASNRVTGHLERNLGTIEQSIVIRQWVDIDPAFEFRAYVYAGRVIGISHYYQYLYVVEIAKQKERFRDAMVTFFEEKVRQRVPLPNYVCDFCVSGDFEVTLIELNPFAPNTSSSLFSWDELDEMKELEHECVFKVLEHPLPNVLEDKVSFRLRAVLTVAFETREERDEVPFLPTKRQRRAFRRALVLGDTNFEALPSLCESLAGGRAVVCDDLRLFPGNQVKQLSSTSAPICATLALLSAGGHMPGTLVERLSDEILEFRRGDLEKLKLDLHNARRLAREFHLL